MNGKGSFNAKQSGLSSNPQNADEVVGFGTGNIMRSEDGGETFDISQTGFTGFAASWYPSAFIYDYFNPYWLGLSLLDVTMAGTDTSGAFF